MVAPGFFDYSQAAADSGHIVGPIIVTFSVVAIWEATRVVRKWNYPAGIWLLIALWVLGYDSTIAIISDMGVGVLVLIFASIQGKIEKSYGGGWSSLWQKNPDHIQKTDQTDL